MKKTKKVREIKYKGLLIFFRKSETPWTLEVFSSKKAAFEYFTELCRQHKWNFDWKDYNLVPCTISFAAPTDTPVKDV